MLTREQGLLDLKRIDGRTNQLTVSTVDRIQDDFRDGRRAKEKMFKFWLEQDPGSTVS